MAKKKTSNSVPVVLKGMTGEEFRDKLNGLRKRATPSGYDNVNLSSDLLINLDTKLFTGGTTTTKEGAEGLKSVPGSMAVNLTTMNNLDMDLLNAMGVNLTDEQISQVQAGTSQYGGNFDSPEFAEFKTTPDGESYMRGTPVCLKVEFDEAKNDAKSELDKYTVTPAIDFQALGTASTNVQNTIRESRGKAPLSDKQAGRLAVTASYPVTKNALGGMNVERLNQNVAKCAAADYVMNASASDPGKNLPKPSDVEAVSALYNKTFAEFVKAHEKKDCKGIPSTKNPGTFATDKDGKQITCPSLQSMGIKPVEVNGAMTLVVTGDESGKAARKEGLKQFNEAFNAKWKQVVNERTVDKDGQVTGHAQPDAVVRMGNAMELNAHAITVRNPYDRDQRTGMVLVQPTLDYKMTPYANALGKSVAVATHQMDADKAYNPEILKNADALSVAFDGPDAGVEKTAEQKAADQQAAIQANAAQFKAICDAVKMDYQSTLEPKDANKEGPEEQMGD